MNHVYTTPGLTTGSLTQRFNQAWHLALKNFRLLIVSQFLRWKDGTEEPKIAIYKGRTAAALHTLPHLPPLAISILLIVFNTRGYFIGTISTTTLAALQFAAKFLEMMIQASIGGVVIGVFRQYTTGTGGVPFGLFVGSSRIDDISLLWSIEFWGSATSRLMKSWPIRALAAMLPPAVILAAIVGPSGAVLMLPRLVADHDLRVLALLDSQQSLFPNTSTSIDGTALADAMHQLSELAAGVGFYILTDSSGSRELLSIDSSQVPASQSADVLISTLPLRETSSALSVLYDLGSAGLAVPQSLGIGGPSVLQTQTKQPLVQAFCQYGNNAFVNGSDPAKSYIDFGTNNTNLKNLVTVEEVLQSAVSNISVYVRPPPADISPPHSALFVYGIKMDPSEGYIADFRACTVNATWATTTVNSSSSLSANFVLGQDGTAVIGKDDLISISTDWTANLTAAVATVYNNSQFVLDLQPDRIIAVGLANGNPSALAPGGPSLAFGPNNTHYFSGLSKQQIDSLSSYIKSNSLDRAYSRIYVKTNTPWTDPSTLTQQVLYGIREGYGYDSSDITVRLSLAVLGLYCATTLAYIVYTFISGLSGTSWDSTSELLMLGMCSHKPSNLAHVSAGVEKPATYKEPVSIRVNPDKELELVFDNDPMLQKANYSKVEVNAEY